MVSCSSFWLRRTSHRYDPISLACSSNFALLYVVGRARPYSLAGEGIAHPTFEDEGSVGDRLGRREKRERADGEMEKERGVEAGGQRGKVGRGSKKLERDR